jgi:hypothetical protein
VEEEGLLPFSDSVFITFCFSIRVCLAVMRWKSPLGGLKIKV